MKKNELNETQRAERGYRFVPSKASMKRIPPLGTTAKVPAEEKIIYEHYFSTTGDWWIAELDPVIMRAFGYAQPSGNRARGRWDYISLLELEMTNLRSGLIVVERELNWTPCKFADLKE